MSIEQPEKNLTPRTPEEELVLLKKKVEENKSDSTIVDYLGTLSTNDLRILDAALNRAGSSFYALNIYEGEEAKNAKAVLAEVLKEPDQKKHLDIIKTLP